MVRHEGRERRTRDARHDPGGREDREHARPERVGIGSADDDVRDRRYGTGAKALNRASGDEHRHRRRESSDEQADCEERETGSEWQRGAEAVGELAREDDSDKVRQ